MVEEYLFRLFSKSIEKMVALCFDSCYNYIVIKIKCFAVTSKNRDMKVSKMGKVKTRCYTLYTADTFCDECGWDMNDLSFNGFVPRMVFASDVEECPYCVVRCDELNKPMILENGEVIDYTPHWFVFGAHNDHEISCSEVFDWLNCT